jgi:hypothetical protein
VFASWRSDPSQADVNEDDDPAQPQRRKQLNSDVTYNSFELVSQKDDYSRSWVCSLPVPQCLNSQGLSSNPIPIPLLRREAPTQVKDASPSQLNTHNTLPQCEAFAHCNAVGALSAAGAELAEHLIMLSQSRLASIGWLRQEDYGVA